MKYIIARFGGIGDAVILTPVAKELKRRGHEVHLSVQESQVELFDNLPECFDEVHPTQRFHGVLDCIKWKWGWTSLESVKDEFQVFMGERDVAFSPVDYKYSIELNANQTHSPRSQYMGYWLRSQNSNYQNWQDLSFGWAGVDPTSVADEDKIPIFRQRPEEKNWAKRELRRANRPIIAIHMVASSLSRTYYKHPDVVQEVIKAFPGCMVLHWVGNSWFKVTSAGAEPLDLPDHKLRHSLALLKMCDLLISTDSAMHHYAAAMGVPSVTTYMTVPAWTRDKYYPNNHAMQGEAKCSPCFNLDKHCPLNQIRAQDSMSDREVEIFRMKDSGMPFEKAAQDMNSQPESLEHEVRAAQQRMEGIAGMTPDCGKSITPEMVVDKAKEVLNDSKKDT